MQPLTKATLALAALALFAARSDATALAARAANPPAPAWTGFKAAWLRDRQPAAYDGAASLLTPRRRRGRRLGSA